jgi:hypothetical protein
MRVRGTSLVIACTVIYIQKLSLLKQSKKVKTRSYTLAKALNMKFDLKHPPKKTIFTVSHPRR